MPEPVPTPDMLEEALRLARSGFSVFPLHTPRVREGVTSCSCSKAECEDIGKHPRTMKGLHDATREESQIREWWAKWPDANIGARTGNGVMVLDADPRHDGTTVGLDLPDTVRVVTGSGGEHVYMTCEGEVRNSSNKIGPGLDIRGDGGYVVAPPSLHVSGRRYLWDAGSAEQMGPAPRWLLELARSKRQAASSPAPDADSFIAGARNDSLTRLAGSMRRRGFVGPAIAAALLEQNAARCRPPLDEVEVRSIANSVAKYAPSAPEKGWIVHGWDSFSSKLSDIQWLCEGLKISPGAPLLVAGYGFSGKTVALQSFAVSLATGMPVWGQHAIERGSFVHVDYEQGKHLTQLRYQRLALGMGVWSELAGQLHVVTLPPASLDSNDGLDKLRGLCEGRRLCIIDSLKAAFPSADENSSDVRKWLDQLTRVSEETGCVVAVIHHARKPSQERSGGAKMAIRGSGAIFDACSGVFVFEGEKSKPTHVSHEKERVTGVTLDDLTLQISDVAIPVEALSPEAAEVTAVKGVASADGLLRSGLRVESVRLERPPTALEAMKARILRNLEERGPARSRNELLIRMGGTKSVGLAALAELIDEGTVIADRNGIRLG